jgi:hypothetical protein
MNMTNQQVFNEANNMAHPVEIQWHYPIMTKYGFVPQERERLGFVRSYNYVHPSGHHIRVTTGASGDYWTDEIVNGERGYWMALEPYIKSLGL